MMSENSRRFMRTVWGGAKNGIITRVVNELNGVSYLGEGLCLGTIFFDRYVTHCFCSSVVGAKTSSSLAVNMSAVAVKDKMV